MSFVHRGPLIGFTRTEFPSHMRSGEVIRPNSVVSPELPFLYSFNNITVYIRKKITFMGKKIHYKITYRIHNTPFLRHKLFLVPPNRVQLTCFPQT